MIYNIRKYIVKALRNMFRFFLYVTDRNVTTNVDLFTDKEIYKRSEIGTAKRYVVANVTDMTFTVSGKVTSWTFFSNYAKEIAFAVWRFYDNESM